MSDFKSLFKHSGYYFFSNIATKALAFVSIPVYTRMLTVEEYGIINVFLSVSAVAAVLLSLNSEVAISRYFFDAKSIDDFKEFVGSTIIISLVIIVFMTFLGAFFLPQISNILAFPVLLTISIIPVSLYSKINSIFTQIYQPLLESKKVALVSSIQVYLAFALSVIFIVLLGDNKYYGYVIGTIAAMFVLSIYMFRQIREYCVLTIKKEHISYILKYCIPYIPYTLSGLIISQFARIFIGSYEGFSSAGIYSLANNIAALMLVIISTTHDAWNPYYFRYMNEKDTVSIDRDYDLIWRLTLFSALFLSLFAFEGGYILAGDRYLKSLYICPFLVLGYVFYQWSYVYLRNTGYSKRVIWNAIAVIISGVTNVLLNAVLIPRHSELGGAISLLISYICLLVISLLFNQYIIKEYVPPIKTFLYSLMVYVPFFAFSVLSYSFTWTWWTFMIKILVWLLLCYFLLKKYKERIKAVCNNYITKHRG